MQYNDNRFWIIFLTTSPNLFAGIKTQGISIKQTAATYIQQFDLKQPKYKLSPKNIQKIRKTL
jgi:hypothetical protein